MTKLSVIIPVYNEAGNIRELASRIHNVLSEAKISYEMIFVNDRSKDKSEQEIKRAALNNSRIVLHNKVGKQGKAFAILEGVDIAKGEIIAMIDGDLQYPPENIPEMYKQVVDTHGIVVANRRNHKTSLLRKIGSKLNVFVFEKLLHGFNCDAQSGLKVFKKEIIQHLDRSEIGEWTLDMPLLHTAQELGHTIGCIEIDFEERRSGESKVNFVKAAMEIGTHALKLKFAPRKVYHITSTHKDGMKGAGITYKRQSYITHTSLSHHESAFQVLVNWQKYFLAIGISAILVALYLNAQMTAIILVAILTFIYFLDFVFSFFVLMKSMHKSPEVSVSDEELKQLDDKSLPIYSILCPLYKEAQVLPHFLDSLATIDYPKNKLDVLLLLEENDSETIDAANALNLPSYVRIVVVPHSFPKTKPKACNYGLSHAKGEFVVIYDAEDKPDPLQLKKAVVTFKNLGKEVFCLQCKLNYYNPDHNILTRLFTAEYSLWFDLMLPGLQSINTTIPLGGTSNHFRTRDLIDAAGWDPFNVTEDCDLGVRIFKKGYKTAVMDSTTYEEANSQVGNWIRQRSRWIKGYFQTYLVHMRNPISFFKTHKHQALLFQLVIGMRMFFVLINPVLWLTTIAYFALYQFVGPAIESLYPPIIFYMGVTCLIFGNFMYLYNYMIGCAKREQWDLMKYVFFIPFYWVITSIAAVMALWQLITRPHYWEKTRHGLHIKKAGIGEKSEIKEVKLSTGETKKQIAFPNLGLDGLVVFAFIFIDILVSSVSLNVVNFESFLSIAALGKIILFSSLLFVGLVLPYFKKLASIEAKASQSFYLFFGMMTFVISITTIGVYFISLQTIKLNLSDGFILYAISQSMLSLAIAISVYMHMTFGMRMWIVSLISSLLLVLSGLIFPHTIETFALSIAVVGYIHLCGIFVHYISRNFVNSVVNNIGYFVHILADNSTDHETSNGLRIVVFNWRDLSHVWGGGAEVYVHELSKRWVAAGHSVTLVCGNDGKNLTKEYVNGIKIVRRGGFYTVYFWAMIYYLLRLRKHTDVIIESVNGAPFFTSVFAPSVPKFLLIHHVHQDVFRNHLPFALSQIAQFVERRLMPYLYRNDKIITISESSKRDIINLGLSNSEQHIDIVNPSIEPRQYKKLKKSADPSFVYLGRLKAYKNIDIAVRAFAQLVKILPKATLSIVGDGEELVNLQHLVNELGISKNVVFHGKVSDKLKASILARSWVLLQPSSVEGWGITVIEANASGTPVIASDVNGLKDSVIDGVTGILVPVRNIEVLYSVMVSMAKSKKLTSAFAKRAYSYSKQFSWDKSAEKFIRIVEQEFDRKNTEKYLIDKALVEGDINL
jgi:cellulose synthase/poly-beta-1,6-N-acetylglucosamine synthase-like glycosyltransferase/glycosyltransferase involved in cell wall biosynthesis